MRYLFIIILIICSFLVSGCLEEEPLMNISDAECLVPSDCEGRIHIQCVGSWHCIKGNCSWECSGENLELPKNDSEWMTG